MEQQCRNRKEIQLTHPQFFWYFPEPHLKCLHIFYGSTRQSTGSLWNFSFFRRRTGEAHIFQFNDFCSEPFYLGIYLVEFRENQLFEVYKIIKFGTKRHISNKDETHLLEVRCISSMSHEGEFRSFCGSNSLDL